MMPLSLVLLLSACATDDGRGSAVIDALRKPLADLSDAAGRDDLGQMKAHTRDVLRVYLCGLGIGSGLCG